MRGGEVRTLRVIGIGLASGLLIGILGPVIFIAANVWDDRRRMTDTTDEPAYLSAVRSSLTNSDLFPYLATVAVAGGVNGAIGAWVGWRGIRGPARTVAVPLLFLLLPMTSCAENPSDSKTWGIELFVVVFIGLFVWVAGRVGQELGTRQIATETSS
jgi:hypothetical protein